MKKQPPFCWQLLLMFYYRAYNNKERLHSLVVSGVGTYAHVPEFHVLVDCSVAYRRHFWHLFMIALAWQLIAHAVLLPPLPSLFPMFRQYDGYLFLLLCGGSWLGCQDLLATGAVFI